MVFQEGGKVVIAKLWPTQNTYIGAISKRTFSLQDQRPQYFEFEIISSKCGVGVGIAADTIEGM